MASLLQKLYNVYCVLGTKFYGGLKKKTLFLVKITVKQNYVQLEEILDQNYSGSCKYLILPKVFAEYAKYSLIYSHF